jgi:hypothetical protein
MNFLDHIMRQTLYLLLATTTLPDVVNSQCSAGPFLGTPISMSFVEGSGATPTGAQLFHKRIGFSPGLPQVWTGGGPVFSLRTGNNGTLCSLWSQSRTLPDIDASSIGEDIVMADSDGRLNVPFGSWGALTFSVTAASRGEERSTIRQERNSRGADVFTYVLPGSAAVMPEELVDRVARALDASEVTAFAGSDVDALDHGPWLFDTAAFIGEAMLTPVEWYFSVTAATATRIPLPFWNGTTPSGATILKMTWDPGIQRWSCPSVFLSYAALGLQADDELDALAVDRRQQYLLFSIRGSKLDQLMFYAYGTDGVGAPVPYTDTTGAPIAPKLGLANGDDLDAICGTDPRSMGGSMALNPMGFFMGTPRPRQFPSLPVADLDASAFRTPAGNVFRTFVKGWPHTGRRPGFASLYMTVGGALGPLQWIATVPRNPLDPICGNPVSADVVVPVVPAMRGTLLDLRWFVGDGSTGVHEAWPLQIRL